MSHQKFQELLQNKGLNGRIWSLLYRGSRDGFEALNFHSCCDGLPNTLTIVKSTNGNVFGGYTIIPWDSSEYDQFTAFKYDNSAFIFSLENLENRPLIFEHINESYNFASSSVVSNLTNGPVFGSSHDLHIDDLSNIGYFSYSNLGNTYIHPEYPNGSPRTKSILAGSQYFKVYEIEVFQLVE